jgi:hypothetical protein
MLARIVIANQGLVVVQSTYPSSNFAVGNVFPMVGVCLPYPVQLSGVARLL